jgi:hypothetical protein
MKSIRSEETIRAIMLISLDTEECTAGGRQSPEEREAAIEKVVESVERVLPEIDAVLERHGGKRVTIRPNALGYVVVETTDEGIKALESLDCVGSIIVDQFISLI